MFESELLDDFGGVGRAIRLSNGIYDLVVTLDVGPRILHFARCGRENILADQVDETMAVGEDTWRLYGGHRIWHAPESHPRTYTPDNGPVEGYTLVEDGLVVTQATDSWTQIRKILEVRFLDGQVRVRSSLENCGAWDVTSAVWSITVVKPGGRVLLPLVQQQGGFQPVSSFAFWSYSRFTDRRITYGSRWLCLDLDAGNREEFKIGYSNLNGWLACCSEQGCFTKRYVHRSDGNYPDFGSSSEVFVYYWGGELETLSPLRTIGPGMSTSHEEIWQIHESVAMPRRETRDLDRAFDAIAGLLAASEPEPPAES